MSSEDGSVQMSLRRSSFGEKEREAVCYGGLTASQFRYDTGIEAIRLSNARGSVVVLPYDSTEQVTSGVLVDAIANGRPVVATAFPHAAELLNTGAGIVVDHDDPVALASALRQIITHPRLAGTTASL